MKAVSAPCAVLTSYRLSYRGIKDRQRAIGRVRYRRVLFPSCARPDILWSDRTLQEFLRPHLRADRTSKPIARVVARVRDATLPEASFSRDAWTPDE